MNRFLGDHPLRVAIKLILLSLVVGWVLNWLDLTPLGLMDWSVERFRDIADVAVSSVGRFGDTILLGAAVVVPLFLLSRIVNYRRG